MQRAEVGATSPSVRPALGQVGEPWLHPRNRIDHFGRCNSEAQSNEISSVDGVKINARRGGYSGVSKQVFAKHQTVVGKILDAGVDIKRAVRRGYLVQAELR